MPRFHRTILILIAFATGFSALSAPAHADVLYSYGFNARGIALGGATAAQVRDFGVAYYNPGGGVFLEIPAIGLGYMRTGNWLDQRYGDKAQLDSTEGTVFGTVLPMPFGGFLKDRLALGIAAFVPRNVFLALDVPYPRIPQYVLLRNSGRQATQLPTLSIRVFDWLGIGGGAQLFSNTDGEINAIIDNSGNTQTFTGQEVFTSFAPTYGIMVRGGEISDSLEGWGLGLVFREEFFTRYRIPINTYIGPSPISLIFQATSIYTPRQWTGGLSYEIESLGLVAEADVSYNEWSGFPDPNLIVDVDFTVPILDIGFVSGEQIDPDFHDTVTVRSGVEKEMLSNDVFGVLAQGGYFWDPTPVPTQSGVTNYLDSDRHVGSLGTGVEFYRMGTFEFAAPLTVQFFGQLHYLVPRVMYKDTEVEAENPGYPKIDVRGWIWGAGVNVTWFFDYD